MEYLIENHHFVLDMWYSLTETKVAAMKVNETMAWAFPTEYSSNAFIDLQFTRASILHL